MFTPDLNVLHHWSVGLGSRLEEKECESREEHEEVRVPEQHLTNLA